MKLEELLKYIETGNEIEFKYDGKDYSITYIYLDDDQDTRLISFCEFYKATTEVKTAEELWTNVFRDGISVGEMLESIDEKDIWIY